MLNAYRTQLRPHPHNTASDASVAKPCNGDLVTGEDLETETETEILESLGYVANRLDTLPHSLENTG